MDELLYGNSGGAAAASGGGTDQSLKNSTFFQPTAGMGKNAMGMGMTSMMLSMNPNDLA